MAIERILCVEIKRPELERVLIDLTDAIVDAGFLPKQKLPAFLVEKDLYYFSRVFPECTYGLTRENISKISEEDREFFHFLARIQPVRGFTAGRIIIGYRFEPETDVGCLRVRAIDNDEYVPQEILDGVYSAVEQYANTKGLRIMEC